MLKHIEVFNFKKLDRLSQSFTLGSNVVVGINGAGKSTLFEAIRFALYGTSAVACNKKNIPTWGAKDCKVVLETHHFTVTRTLKNCTVSSPDGTLLAEGHSPSNDYIAEQLGMDHKAFSIFAMSCQGETQALLTLGVTELNRRVENYSGVEIIDKIIRSASKDVTYLSGSVDSKELVDLTALTSEQEREQKSLLDLETTEHELNDSMVQLQVNLKQNDDEHFSLNVENQAIHEAKRLVDMLERDTSKTMGKISTLNESLNSLIEPAPFDPEKIADLRTQIKLYTDDLQQLTKLKQCKTTLENEVTSLQPSVDKEVKAEKELAELAETTISLQLAVDSTKELLHSERDRVNSIRTLIENSTCPTCKQSITDCDPEADAEKLAIAKKSYAAAYDCHAVVVTDNNDHKRILDQLHSDMSENARGYQAKKIEALASLRPIDEDLLANLPEWIMSCQNELEDLLECKNAHVSYTQRKSVMTNTLNDLKADLQNDLDDLEPAKVRAASNIIDLSIYKQKESKIKSALDANSKLKTTTMIGISKTKMVLHNLNTSIVAGKEHNAQLGQELKRLDLTSNLLKLLRENRLSFMQTVWDRILIASSTFLTQATDGWLTGLGRDDSGNFTYNENGSVDVPVAGCASGAQKAFLGVALRLGLAQALHGSHPLLMLDEPTEAMSESNAERLANSLLELGGQTIFITHRESDLLTARNIITIE